MTPKNPHAKALGRLGGLKRASRMTADERSAAARKAGKLGGRPRKNQVQPDEWKPKP